MATPPAASSGSQTKAHGLAGGYLLTGIDVAALKVLRAAFSEHQGKKGAVCRGLTLKLNPMAGVT